MPKKYEFTLAELCVLREALIEYSHRISPPADASDNRKRNYRTARALADQFVADIRLSK